MHMNKPFSCIMLSVVLWGCAHTNGHDEGQIERSLIKKFEYLKCSSGYKVHLTDATPIDNCLDITVDEMSNFINWLNSRIEKDIDCKNTPACFDETSELNLTLQYIDRAVRTDEGIDFHMMIDGTYWIFSFKENENELYYLYQTTSFLQ